VPIKKAITKHPASGATLSSGDSWANCSSGYVTRTLGEREEIGFTAFSFNINININKNKTKTKI